MKIHPYKQVSKRPSSVLTPSGGTLQATPIVSLSFHEKIEFLRNAGYQVVIATRKEPYFFVSKPNQSYDAIPKMQRLVASLFPDCVIHTVNRRTPGPPSLPKYFLSVMKL